MKIKHLKSSIASAVALALVVTAMTASAQTQTTDTRIGKLNFERGYPTKETTRKVFDEMDYQRAVQAYLWAYPAVSFESIRIGVKRDLGLNYNEFTIADAKSVWLTANDSTVYALAVIDLGKYGPMVVDVPPGAIVGLIDDYWQRSLTDLGLPGPDGDKGGKFLVLPPGYSGEVPKEGYHVLQGTMNDYNVMVRGIAVKGDFSTALQVVSKMNVYPWSECSNPKAARFVSFSGKVMDTFRQAASNTGRGCPTSSTTTRSRSAIVFSWRCSSRWASRKARSSSPMRGSARSSKTLHGWAMRWAA
jgi:hypothetical protein